MTSVSGCPDIAEEANRKPFRIPRDRVRGALAFDFIRPPARRVTFTSLLLDATDDVVVAAHESAPSTPLDVQGERVVDRGYWAVWFIFKGQPFDVGRFYRPDGTWTGYYVDILEPVRWRGADPTTLEPIVDLFLDLWVSRDGRYTVLDEDEFEEAVRRGILTARQAGHARRVLDDLVGAVGRGAFPPPLVRDFRL
jgi:predicted RNA-binding protein associated with RNAse of E/G family